MSHSVSIKDLSLSFGAVKVLENLNLDIVDGEFIVLLGSSGCGKSTLLNCIAGLLEPTDGQIFIKGKNVTWEEPKDRGIGMVFQSYALYPQMSVKKNLSFGLQVAKMPKEEIEKRVQRAADILQIGPLLDRKPSALSGGQRQRVAIGRALVRDVDVFLFDEPLSNLDAKLRSELRVEIKRLHHSLKNTMIYVTHDQIEAMTMADRIVVLNAGNIAQVGAPLELYHKPQNTFVAGFIGNPKMNFVPVTCVGVDAIGVTISYEGQTALIPVDARPDLVGQTLTLGIRPEHTRLSDGDINIVVTPYVIERLGINTIAYATLPNGEAYCALLPGSAPVRAEQPMTTGIMAADCHLFDADGQALERRIDWRTLDLPASVTAAE